MDHEQAGMFDADPDRLIRRFAAQVRHASFKVAQCAVLCARGYHYGIIPVDSGMVTKLGPALGVALPQGPVAHEALRLVLQRCVTDQACSASTVTRRLAGDSIIRVLGRVRLFGSAP
ncbi:MAG: hypothetical protein ACRDT0_18825 [Pseudonocardiaceae bacterium]